MTIVLMLVIPMPLCLAQTSQDDLVLTVHGNGLVRVDYYLESGPLELQVEVLLFGDEYQGLVIRDENGDPLDSTLNGSALVIDSIGASRLYISYYSESLVQTESGLTHVSVTSPVSTTIILPNKADFFDMSDIPIEITEENDAQSLRFEAGDIFVYYMIGLPELDLEATAALEKAYAYLDAKLVEGYLLTGASESLSLAITKFQEAEYYQSKLLANDALRLAVLIVETADIATDSLLQAQSAVDQAEVESTSVLIVEAKSLLRDAQVLFDEGYYIQASLTALSVANTEYGGNAPSLISLFRPSLSFILVVGICVIIFITKSSILSSINYVQRGGTTE